MSDSPTLFPRLSKGFTFSSTALSPIKVASQPTKIPSNPNSPKLPPQRGTNPSIFFSDESPITPAYLPWSSYAMQKQDSLSIKPQRSVVDVKTLTFLEQIIEERQSTFKNPTSKDRTSLKRRDSIDITQITREQKIIGKIENFMKFKGLDPDNKEKQFDNKMEFFEQVKTYVDPRKLFTEKDEQSKLSARLNRAETQDMTQQSLKFLESRTARGSQDTSLRSSRNMPFIPMRESPTLRGKTSEYYTSPAPIRFEGIEEDISLEPVTELNETDRKRLEIRALYQQLKENTIKKFGPGIFETAQKQLRNPAHLQILDKKRRDEVSDMRKLQEELGDLDLGRKLMNNLLQRSGSGILVQDDAVNPFDNYVKHELKHEDESPTAYTSRPLRPTFTFLSESVRKTEPNEKQSKIFDQFDDPQIALLRKLQEHKDKSQEVLKALREKIGSFQKKELIHTEGSCSPRTTRTVTSPRKLKHNHLGISQDFMGHNRIPLIPSIMLKLEKEIEIKNKESTKESSSKAMLMKNASTPHLRLATDSNVNHTESDLYTERPPDVRKRKGRTLTVQTKNVNLNQIGEKKQKKNKSIGGLSAQKDKLMGICNDLESLATTNKDLNKQLEASIKEMSNSYTKKSNLMKKDYIPDALRKPETKIYTKSTAKLANSLAARMYRSGIQDSYFGN